MSAPVLPVPPLPGLAVCALRARLPGPLGGLPTAALAPLLRPDAAAPLRSSEELRKAVRDVLRQRGYRPTGRGKPSSEYLAGVAAGEGIAGINPVVDAGNAVSLHSGLPISVVDLGRTRPPLLVRIGGPGDGYVFNRSGQVIDVAGLPCLWDAEGPCANAVKDAQRTKTDADTREVLAVVWGVDRPDPERPAAAARWLAELLRGLGAEVEAVSTAVTDGPA